MLPPDNHVHTEYSYDTVTPPGTTLRFRHSDFSYDTTHQASMRGACERALAVGVAAVAFTEHLDFSTWDESDPIAATGLEPRHRTRIRPLDVAGYFASVQECRERYPGLRVLSGVEAGEPHLFAASAGAVVTAHPFDRVLGSLHALPHRGELAPIHVAFRDLPADEVMRRYFTELLRLVEESTLFGILAHMDFPRRYWPAGAAAYEEKVFEEEYRAVLRALATSGRVFEVNTKSPLASAELVRWWREEGGGAVSFGSDAHENGRVGDRFDLAVDVVESAGFRPGRDRFDFWRR